MRNRLLTRQSITLRAWLVAAALLFCALLSQRAMAATDEAAVSTINHAFATELGTGVYDMGGRGIFVIRLTPQHELRAASGSRPGVRLVMPIAAGSFDFNPFDSLQPDVPNRVDSLSVMPGVEFDFPQGGDWMLTPWIRAGASFSEGQSDGLLYGAGARLVWEGERGGLSITRLHELAVVNVDYRASIPHDTFVRMRNAVDLRRPTLRLTRTRHLLAGVYAITDIVTDPPDVPLQAGEQTIMQLEFGVTFNAEPRPRIGSWRWPRLGFGYRIAGDFSGWRIVVGAPF
jgi:hypothetical protein